jgi:hypothetical protein
MTFLNPFVLLGLAAASIPVVLHLLNLRKLKQIDFSTLRFIKELQKTRLRRLRIKRIILLVLRTLLIIFAVLAFARPVVQTGLPLLGSYASTSAVIIIDNSLSMDVSDEKGNRLNHAKTKALQILKSMKEGDKVTVIQMSNPPNREAVKLSRNLEQNETIISDIKPAPTTANVSQSLRLAYAALEESSDLNKEIYILSDAQPNVFYEDSSDSLRIDGSGATVYFLPLGNDNGLLNVSIDSVNLVSRIFQQNKAVEIEANVKNYSTKEVKGALVGEYFNKKRIAQRITDLPAGESRQVIISGSPTTSGAISGYIEIENDALDADNRRFFGFIIPEKSHLALIGSSADLIYLNAALAVGSDASPSIIDTYQPNQFSGIDLSKYQIVVLAGGALNDSEWRRLELFVRNGGGILIFAQPANSSFASAMSIFGFSDLTARDFDDSNPAGFSSVDRLHPIFSGVFKGTTESANIVESPQIYKAMTTLSGQAIINMPGGAFLSENTIGEGKALYISVAPTLEWSSFPLTGIFPATIYRSVQYLSSTKDFGVSVEAGKTVNFNLPKRFATGGSFRIVDPDGIESYAQSVELPSGSVLSLDKLEQLGNYIIYSSDNKPIAIISVNVSPSESYLKPATADEIQKNLQLKLGDKTKIELIDEDDDIEKNIIRARTGSELWQLFLLLAVICAVAEMIVARNAKGEVVEAVE